MSVALLLIVLWCGVQLGRSFELQQGHGYRPRGSVKPPTPPSGQAGWVPRRGGK